MTDLFEGLLAGLCVAVCSLVVNGLAFPRAMFTYVTFKVNLCVRLDNWE